MSSFSRQVVVVEGKEEAGTTVLVFIGDVDSSLVWVEAPFKVLQDVEIVLVKAVSSVEEAAEIGKLLSVLQEAVMVFVIRLLSVVVAVEMAKLGLSE